MLAWRAMMAERCDRDPLRPAIILRGLRSYSHLHSLVSEPAVCLGWESHVARTHLNHPPEWEPPDEHRQMLRRSTDDIVHQPATLKGAPAPEERCTCGYYALFEPRTDPTGGVTGVLIWCYVLAIGKSVFYTKGVRMERYRLLRWWWPAIHHEYEDRREPVAPNSYSNVYALTSGYQRLLWREVVERLVETYGLEPAYGDPREAELPTGMFDSIPANIGPLLS